MHYPMAVGEALLDGQQSGRLQSQISGKAEPVGCPERELALMFPQP